MRVWRWTSLAWWLAIALAVVAWAEPSAGPWPLPGAGAPLSPGVGGGRGGGASGHAWVAIPLSNRVTPSVRESAVFHMPPRDEAGLAPAGTLKLAARLNTLPLALAAWGARLDVVFGPTAAIDDPIGLQRRVVRVSASASLAGTWEYLPETGPAAQPPLPGDGELMGFAGGPRGPLALLKRDLAKGGWTLLGLEKDEWREIPLPKMIKDDVAGVRWDWGRLVSGPSGPVLVLGNPPAPTGESSIAAYRGQWLEPSPEGEPTPAATLSEAQERVTTPAEFGDASQAAWMLLDGQLVAVAHGAQQRFKVYVLYPSVTSERSWARSTADLGVIDAPAALVGLGGLGRVAAVWEAPTPPASSVVAPPTGQRSNSRPVPSFMTREVSVVSGLTYFDGPASREGLLSSRDFQLLAVILGGLMLAVLLFVLRSEAQDALPIPKGFSLASPGRRLAAALIDLAVPVGIVCLAYGIGPDELIGWNMLMGRGGSVQPLVLAWAVGLALGIVSDTAGGRSIGRRICGCVAIGYRRRVVEPTEGSDRPAETVMEPASPTLRQAFLRNMVKWCIPPLTMLVLFDQNFRHPGDVLAGTVVLERDEEDGAGEL